MALAGHFARGKVEKALLVFDEVDALIFNRGQAMRSFEISLTGVLLEQMHDHPLPFVCCTDAAPANDRLAPAILRRFTFKIAYHHLTPIVARGLLQHLFGQTPPAALGRLATLPPGDFACVAKRAGFLGCLDDAAQLTEMLAAECAIKGESARTAGSAIPEPATAVKLLEKTAKGA